MTPGKALCGDGTTVSGALDQASTMDSDGLCVRIHWTNKTRTAGMKSACVLPPAVAQRLFKCLGEIWSIAMPLYSANPNWVTETMSPHFKSPHSRWAPLREVLGDETTFTAYNLKHLSVISERVSARVIAPSSVGDLFGEGISGPTADTRHRKTWRDKKASPEERCVDSWAATGPAGVR